MIQARGVHFPSGMNATIATEKHPVNLELSYFKSVARKDEPMTGMYLCLLLTVGNEGPIVTRKEALAALYAAGYETHSGLDGHLGVRSWYHADVVAAWIGA